MNEMLLSLQNCKKKKFQHEKKRREDVEKRNIAEQHEKKEANTRE